VDWDIGWRSRATVHPAMVNKSLAARLIVAAASWSAVALAIAAFVLISLERQTIERRFDEQLGIYAKTIIGEISVSDPEQLANVNIGTIGEPRFSLPLHGWYWQIATNPEHEPVNTSASLVGERLALLTREPGTLTNVHSGQIMGPNEDKLRVVEYDIVFEKHAFTVSVAAETSSIDKDVAAFRNNLLITFVVFAFGLLLATFVQVKIGLRPLNVLRDALGAIRIGETERLEGNYPTEIAPVVAELNALVTANREIVDRSRTQVGNLAHALKTPLSVITNEARSAATSEAQKIAEQADVMRDQVNLYLDRARMAAQRRMIGAVAEIEPVLQRLKRVLERLNRDRGLEIDLRIEPGLKFRGEAQDIEEMLGNLLDNGCKWARRRVRITAETVPSVLPDGRAMLSIAIEDDGPGLPADKRQEALQRGKRLDETVPGTGLGLAIVKDIAALYGGELTLRDSELSGLKAELRLPALVVEKPTRPKFRHTNS